MVKKFFALIVAATFLLTLPACGSNENPNSDALQSESTAVNSQESRSEAVSSEPIESSSSTDVVSSGDNASSGGQTMSLDTLCSTIKGILKNDYTGCTVTHDGNTITVSVWLDGVAHNIVAGGDAVKDSWKDVKDNMSELSKSIGEFANTAGYDDISVLLHVLNDQNLENALLSISDGVVIYDVLETE